MILYTNNKNKVSLEDYPFKLDIHRRRCVSRFTPFERDLFYEMCLGRLKTTVEDLAEDLDVDPAIILAVLKKNNSIGLFNLEGHDVVINKEERKLYEVELEKFNDSFVPNLNHLRALFSKVPIDVIPRWFALPKSCDAIYTTLLDVHFETPKTFERYMRELEFDDPILNRIIKQLYTSTYYYMTLQEIKEEYFLSDEILYQIIAILEFNLLLVHSYHKVGDVYHEVVTPPYEYRQLLLDKLEKKPKTISEEEKAITVYTLHQDYIPKVTRTLKTIKDLMKGEKGTDIHADDLTLVKRLLEIDLLDTHDKEIVVSQEGNYFLNQTDSERMCYFLNPKKGKNRLFSEWVQRQIEKELLAYDSWIFVDDFISSLQIPLDSHAPLQLIRKGRSSYYAIPVYNEEERESIRTFLCDHLAVANVIELGESEGKTTLRITKFGRDTLN